MISFSDRIRSELQVLQTDTETIPANDDIVKFWTNVATVTHESGEKKIANLSRFALSILFISHGNATPERGFSVMRVVLN